MVGKFIIAQCRVRHLLTGVNLHILPGGPIQTNGYLLTAAGTG